MVPPPAAPFAALDDAVLHAAETAWQPAIPSLPDAFRSIHVPSDARFWRKLLAFTGPGYVIAVGYMDPGNWATDIAGGSQFGYLLFPAIFFSNFIAIFLQHLALKLGIASGCDLAQACRNRFGKRTAVMLWAAAEVAIVACDLAEVIGTAVALKLLFGLPLLIGVALTVVDTLVLLSLMKRGMRWIEAFITSLLALVGCCFVIELLMVGPDFGALTRSFATSGQIVVNPTMLYLALGIFGATVMPHNLYLHSALVQSRKYERTPAGKREAIFFGTLDSSAALMLALFVNGAILVLAAAAFNSHGMHGVVELEDAYHLLSPVLGTALGGILFGVALLASGQNSTVTGTLAGQIVMEGMLGLKMSPFRRRLITRSLAIIPAFAAIAFAGEGATTSLLILSQVVLSMQLAFAVIPLVIFTSDKKLMGSFANGAAMRWGGIAVAVLIVGVNGWLFVQTIVG